MTTNVTQSKDVGIAIADICRGTIIIFLSTISIIGHSINIRAIHHVSSLGMSGATKLLYRALSVADILTCTALIFGVSIGLTGAETVHSIEIVCKLTGLLMTCAPGTSAIFILLLNVDRFIYITRPLLYHSIVTTRKTAIGIGIAIPYVSVSVASSSFIHDKDLSVIRHHESIFVCKVAFSEPSFLPKTLVMFSFNMWPVALILIVIYCKIIMISRQHIARINAHRQVLKIAQQPRGNSNASGEKDVVRSAAPNFDSSLTRSFRQNIRTLWTPLLITGCYLLSWIPFSVLEVYIAVTKSTDLLNGSLYITVATAAALNSSANLLVYYLSRKDLRQAVKRVLCRREN
ncbi:probable G-protein coupled receptor 21 [Strongylocentrotus purpuratus]|uniref:G-protein coupled receptors family 1 profile domain-containing protein n=1 Tax=Strongylocentrotus purpuratus TaxID=7668 RepID=A0A7M7FZW6_STRPU|nr:probable G-protein coupled receptor 21 [Strongylocentrotus purpuratus]